MRLITYNLSPHINVIMDCIGNIIRRDGSPYDPMSNMQVSELNSELQVNLFKIVVEATVYNGSVGESMSSDLYFKTMEIVNSVTESRCNRTVEAMVSYITDNLLDMAVRLSTIFNDVANRVNYLGNLAGVDIDNCYLRVKIKEDVKCV